jgi:hypothetical protein
MRRLPDNRRHDANDNGAFMEGFPQVTTTIDGMRL